MSSRFTRTSVAENRIAFRRPARIIRRMVIGEQFSSRAASGMEISELSVEVQS